MPRQPKGLTYRMSWVDARDPLFTYTKTYATVIPAIRLNIYKGVGDPSLRQSRDFLLTNRFETTRVSSDEHYTPDMAIVRKCVPKVWLAAFDRLGPNPVARQLTDRTNPYGPLSLVLNVGTDHDRSARVHIHLQPYVNGKVPFTSVPD
jgi:hypothetical protein